MTHPWFGWDPDANRSIKTRSDLNDEESECQAHLQLVREISAGTRKRPSDPGEYGDFECPSCGEAYPFSRKLSSAGGSAALCLSSFPLPRATRMPSMPPRRGSSFAQEKFWPMLYLFEHQQALDDAHLVQAARDAHSDTLEGNLKRRRCDEHASYSRVRDPACQVGATDPD